MFKQLMTWLVMTSYVSHLLTAAFTGVLVGVISLKNANATPVAPVAMVSTCPTDTDKIGGSCIKNEKKPIQKRCEAGYILDVAGEACFRDESINSTEICPENYNYNKSLFVDKCYKAYTNPNPNYCPSPYSKQAGGCYKTEPVQAWNCPVDDPNANSTQINMTCMQQAIDMDLCEENNEAFSTPDQRWKLQTPPYICKRKLWTGAEIFCDAGFVIEGGQCARTTTTLATRSCPFGTYEEAGQCITGSAPSCPAGSTMRFGVCKDGSGNLSCPTGSYLETSSNLCVANRTDSQPAVWTTEDFDALYEQGADLGGNIAKSTAIPSLSMGGGINTPPTFLNANVSVQDENLFKALQSTGVDSNNGYTSPAGTYQEEDAQTDFIKVRVEKNQAYLDNEANVTGATSEELVDNTDHAAVAYGTLVDTRNMNPPRKLSRDSAMFQTSANAVGDAVNGTGAYFGDCSDSTVTYQELDESKIVTTKSTCFKPNKNNTSGCIVDRILIPSSLNIIEGADNANLEICGEKCVRLTLGVDGDNYLTQVGSCGIYEENIKIGLVDGNVLTKATIIGGSYDDHMRLSADNNVFFNGVHGEFDTADGFPTTETYCEMRISRTVGVQDVTPEFVAAFEDDDQIDFKYKAGAGGEGEAYAFVELIFEDPITTRWSEEFVYTPEGCNEKLDDPQTFCTADQFVCDNSIDWTPVFLGEWATDDVNGQWEIQGNPNDVMQIINGDPTSFISEKSYELNSFKGNIVVQDNKDDDFIGFVFGLPEKGADLSLSENSYFLVSWKQGSQKGAQKGIVLAEVTGSMDVIPWAHQTSTANYKVLATNLGVGWQANKQYEFQLDIMPDNFVLSIDGIEKLSINENFHKGRIGFYNSSQSAVLYSQIKQLYPAGLGRDAEFIFKPLWSDAENLNEATACLSAHRADYVCDPLKGLSLNINGGSFGFKDIISMNDGCDNLDHDDQCDAISQKCVDGWESGGVCYAWDVNYECQDLSNAVVTKTRDNNTCMTDTSCIDGSCDVKAEEENGDFIEALTTYGVMNEMGNKQVCDVPNDPNTCKVFAGEARYCSWDQLKVNDCCEQPAGVGVGDVFKLGVNLYTVEGYMSSATGAFSGKTIQTGLQSAGAAVEGAWTTLKEPVVDAATTAWQAVSSNFTGAVASTSGNTSANLVSEAGTVLGNFKSSALEAMTNFKDTLLQEIYNMLPDALQQTIQSAATALGGAGAGGGAQTGAAAMNTIGSNVMSVVSFIGWAYAVYQIAKLAYTLLTACKEEEEDMGTMLLSKKCFKTYYKKCKKTLGVCTNKASNQYCCYDSVLSRIIMDQAVDQLGWAKRMFRNTMGCRGLTITELGQVNFSAIDFSEWINLMAQSDSLPVDKTMETVTGDNISNGFGRQNTLERNEARAPNNEWVDLRENIEEGDVGNNVNCNKRPRPKSCEQDVW